MKNKKILIVEDDPFLLKVFAAHLQEAGIETMTIADGGKALPAVSSFKPSLILLDIGLPHKNGFEILRELKKKKTTKDIPVFLCTKLGSDEDRKLGMELGAAQYYHKAHISFPEIVHEAITLLS